MLTSTDYIGIGVLITTVTTGIIQIINTFRLKSVEAKVDGNTTAQATLIAHLQNKLTDKDSQISDAKQTAAVLAATVPLNKIETNTKDTVDAIKRK